MMARDIFVLLVSTVLSESCFSSANRIIIDRRNILSVKTFKRLVYLKNWFDAEQHSQHSLIEAPSSGEFMIDADGDSDGI
jgi:hAT family C-terminal dimerisation region